MTGVPDREPVPLGPELRIGSYNIHRAIGRDRAASPARIAEVIGELDCDTIGLQEVSSRGGGTPEAMQMDFMRESPGKFFPLTHSRSRLTTACCVYSYTIRARP